MPLAVVLSGSGPAGDWRFSQSSTGPKRQTAQGLPESWLTRNLVWKTTLLPGQSSPAGDRIFLTITRSPSHFV
jgi:hypothetical protein